jgi:hypothetical protein
MSIYSEKLAILKREISIISGKKKKKFKRYQKDMIEFIHSRIEKVEFELQGKTIVLEKGDSKKGFIHILEKHYHQNDLETMDILNLPIMFKNALQLINQGISNNALTVYKKLGQQKEHRLVINEITKEKLVVTTYRKN